MFRSSVWIVCFYDTAEVSIVQFEIKPGQLTQNAEAKKNKSKKKIVISMPVSHIVDDLYLFFI